jgi:hydrogenase expression/formation protein HypE
MIVFVPEPDAGRALDVLRAHPVGAAATHIGSVGQGSPGQESPGMVVLKTRMGARRLLDLLSGEQLPRIC